MKALWDTSVIIAGMLPDHVHHSSSRPWLERAKQRAFEFCVSAHGLVEVYSVLTRLPRRPKIKALEALQLIDQNIRSCAEIVSLNEAEYGELIDRLAAMNIIGGAAYDAITATAADKANVDFLLTFDTGHFQRVWPQGTGRIVTPSNLSLP